MRKLLLLLVCTLVSIGTWAAQIGSGSGTYEVADGVVTFSGTTAGEISQNWNSISNNFGGATRIKFDNTCVINKDDLMRFLSANTYYIDLLDITNGTNTPMHVDADGEDDDNDPANIDKIIEAAVEQMMANSAANVDYKVWQAKGIILPLNTSLGTSKVERPFSMYGSLQPTFTEYAVYYRSNQKIATIYAHDTYIKDNQAAAVTNAQTNYNTAYAHLTENRTIGAETYIVSTNNQNRINLSSTIPSGKTKISIINDEMIYRETLANIYVETSGENGGKFAAAVDNTNIEYTPCNQLVIEGPINGDDVAAVNEFNKTDDDGQPLEGPHVYNFAATTGATKSMLSTITNSKLEYIVLPNALATEQIVASDFNSSLTAPTSNLKTAIAPSDDSKKLSAYVKEAGSLGMARYYATDGSYNQYITPQYSPYTKGLTDVILTGNLNASDINSNGNVGADGHWSNSNVSIAGLNGEAATLKTFDLEKAVFADNYDMNFSKAGYEKLTSVILPTSEDMTIISKDCLYNNPNLEELCIPFNYEVIEDGALLGTSISHITTTDAINGAVVDNGPLTYTLSANLQQLGIKPNPVTNAISECVFPVDQGVLDIYSMATTTPKCYKGVFSGNSCYGNGGFLHDVPYCRDKYYNGNDTKKSLAVLHFPSKETFEKATVKEPTGYEDMKKFYTDVNKHFTKLEQTGAVDANGESITWPTQEEMYRTYNQASLGLTWNDWVETYTMADVPQVCGGQPAVALSNDGVYSKNDQPSEGNHKGDYPFDEYAGWHQLVLSQATYYEPTEIVEDEQIVREYEDAGWFTFCIPFNMTYKQVVEMLGVPASTDKVVNMLAGEEVTGDIMPDIRQLSSVTREKGSGSKNNKVTLRLTPNLYGIQTPGYTSYLEITHNENSETHKFSNAEPYNASSNIDDRLCLIGGRPYVIKAYKRKQIVDGKDIYAIKGQNIAKAILTRYADQFGIESSIVDNTKYESYLSYEQLGDGNLKTLRFAKPFEDHRVQAVRADDNAAYLTYKDGDKVKNYYYTMIGQFWDQDLPHYSIYMAKGKWYRYDEPAWVNKYKWDAYKCIILATEEIAGTKGFGYRDESKSVYPTVQENTTDKLNDTFSLTFLDGRNDDDFDNDGTSAKYVFAFEDDGIMEFDEIGNEVTAIKNLDGEDLTIDANDCRIYNMSGQFVGSSLKGLGKGMYIVNGKKFVVK